MSSPHPLAAILDSFIDNSGKWELRPTWQRILITGLWSIPIAGTLFLLGCALCFIPYITIFSIVFLAWLIITALIWFDKKWIWRRH